MPYALTEKDDRGKNVTVERLETNVEHKGLGVHSAPDGSFTQQIQASLENKFLEFKNTKVTKVCYIILRGAARALDTAPALPRLAVL